MKTRRLSLSHVFGVSMWIIATASLMAHAAKDRAGGVRDPMEDRVEHGTGSAATASRE